MLNLWSFLVGPLAGPECRRALSRGWVILARTLAAVAMLGLTLVVIWWWWVVVQSEPDHSPFWELRIGLTGVEGMLLAVALVMGPAVMAGTLAGEKERGILALLVTTEARSREIVTGRLLAKLSQVGLVLLAGVPAVVLLASLAGFDVFSIGLLLALPAAVAWGGGGVASLTSALSRRGRDALLTVYLVEFVVLATPLAASLGLPPGGASWAEAGNPFAGMSELVWSGSVGGAMLSVGLWLVAGLAGVALASWRLRPACLAVATSADVARVGRRGLWVPPVDERRPMLWKELFIERVASLGRVGTWVGRLIAGGLLGSTLALSAVLVWQTWRPRDPYWSAWAAAVLTTLLGRSGAGLSVLIQWAVGLRAAVSISSERERGTWDGLLTSSLEPGEIVRGKLWGSLYALRWLVLALFLSWAVGVATTAIPLDDALRWGAETLVVGLFMAAVGVRVSLESQTATRAMVITLGVWLAAYVVISCIALLSLALIVLTGNMSWIILAQLGAARPLTGFWFPGRWSVTWPLTNDLIYLIVTAIVAIDTRLLFDRLAGRITGGRAAVAIDEFLYGRPVAPVLAGEEVQTKPESVDELPRPVPGSGEAVARSTGHV